ncbi:MAG: hypothetical protein ACOC2V_04750 [Alkalispirochaeta sp.]
MWYGCRTINGSRPLSGQLPRIAVEGTFFYVPFSGLQSMVEVFRRRVITLLVDRELLNEDLARNLVSWKHSGV